MGLLGKVFGGSQDPDEITDLLGSPRNAERFRSLIQSRLADAGIHVEFDAHTAIVTSPSDREGQQFILLDVAQRCASADAQDEWTTIVNEYIEGMLGAELDETEVERNAQDFEWASPRLRLRVTDADERQASDVDPFAYREIIPGLATYLAFDLPSSIQYAAAELPETWGMDFESLVTIALENTSRELEAEGGINTDELDAENDAKLTVLLCDCPHVASLIHDPDRFADHIGAGGLFLSVPTQRAMMLYPIEGVSSLPGVKQLIELTWMNHERGPNSVSPRIFWLYDGVFREVKCEVVDNAIRVMPPNEFAAVLNELQQQELDDQSDS